jgi:acyl-CoA synthetase (AMP-forming)/AMP-acid ligase II
VTAPLRAELWFERPYDALVSGALRWPRSPFLCVLEETAHVFGIEAREYTFEESLSEVQLRRMAFQRCGVRPGHRVGLMLENRPDFFFHWLALNALGAAVVPLNADWRGAELEYVIDHSDLVMAVAPEAECARLAEAAAAARREVVLHTAESLRDTEAVGARMAPAPANEAAAGRTALARTNEAVAERVGLAPTTGSAQGSRTQIECALLYTSGTTGRPKGCVLPNEYFVWAGQWYASIGDLCEVREASERMLTPLPVAHMNAMAYSAMCMLLTGGCLIALDRFHPNTWWTSVRDSRATIVHYLGVMPAMLLSAPPSAEDRSHGVRFGFGAGVNGAHHAAFEERFGFPLLEAWAMTETGAGAVVIANREPRRVGTACFGRAAPAVEYRIVEETGVDVAACTPGELLVRAAGPAPRFGFFDRYLKDPQATAEAWAGGWFHTGDVVRVDAQGDLHFVDRRKNVIRRSGENISAVEVEVAIGAHPLVRAIGVTGVPDAVRGEEVLACVVPNRELSQQERDDAARDLVEFALTRLAYFKPPGFVHFCDALPRTATEKIQRGELKRLALEALASDKIVDTRPLKRRDGSSAATGRATAAGNLNVRSRS